MWLLVTGKIGDGVTLLLWGLLVVSWVDNIVRPLVISNATRMPFLLVVFGVYSQEVVYFGAYINVSRTNRFHTTDEVLNGVIFQQISPYAGLHGGLEKVFFLVHG